MLPELRLYLQTKALEKKVGVCSLFQTILSLNILPGCFQLTFYLGITCAGTDRFLGFVEGLITNDPYEASQVMEVPADMLMEFKTCLELCGPAYNVGHITLKRLMEVIWAPFLRLLAARIHQVQHQKPSSWRFLLKSITDP